MFRIATVCTGNVCRSVLAEAVLKRDLPSDIFYVTSAGIRATTGMAVPARQISTARKLGVSGLEEHTARAVSVDTLAGNDLILGMSRGHRRRLLQLDTASARRTFTLREFARLAPLVTTEGVEQEMLRNHNPLRAAVAAVALKRGLLPPPKKREDLDIVDPYLQSRRVYRQSRDQLVPAAETTATFLNLIVDLFGPGDVAKDDALEVPILESSPTPRVAYPSRRDLHS